MMGVVELVDDDILHLRDNRATCAFFGVPAGQTANRLATAMGVPREGRRAPTTGDAGWWRGRRRRA